LRWLSSMVTPLTVSFAFCWASSVSLPICKMQKQPVFWVE
jgi:hypothetical protein